MANENTPSVFPFSADEWIVHRNYGVGKIEAIVEKSIGESKSTYYRIKTRNSLIFAPVDDESLLRPVTPPNEFSKALDLLKKPSKK